MKLPPNASEPLTASQIADLRLAASKMHGAERRAFQAEMALKYCQGSPRLTETVFGWGRENVTVGLAQKRTGITCVGAQSFYGGAKPWEEQQPEAAEALRLLAQEHSQQDPSCANIDWLYSSDGKRSHSSTERPRNKRLATTLS